MRNFFDVVVAEIRKQNRIFFHGSVVYFSLVLWPVLELLAAFYMFSPFVDQSTTTKSLQAALGSSSVQAFLVVGYMGYLYFFSVVRSAWRFTNERFEGTLELILLTPANRFAVMLGNACSSLFGSVWLITVFAAIAYILFGQYVHTNLALLPISFVALTLAAIAWGTLMNSFFLLARDPSMIFNVLQGPLNFFGGVRVPITLLGGGLQLISACIPLSYCLIILRQVLLAQAQFVDILPGLIDLAVLVVIMFGASYGLLIVAESHAKKHGTLTLF